MSEQLVIGDKVGSKRYDFWEDGEDKITCRTVYCPRIEVNGRMMNVSDETSKSGIIECEDRYEARKKAKEIRDRLQREAR